MLVRLVPLRLILVATSEWNVVLRSLVEVRVLVVLGRKMGGRSVLVVASLSAGMRPERLGHMLTRRRIIHVRGRSRGRKNSPDGKAAQLKRQQAIGGGIVRRDERWNLCYANVFIVKVQIQIGVDTRVRSLVNDAMILQVVATILETRLSNARSSVVYEMKSLEEIEMY